MRKLMLIKPRQLQEGSTVAASIRILFTSLPEFTT